MRADGVGVGIKRWKHATDDDPFQLVFATSRDRRLVLLMLNNGDANRLFAVLVSALVDAMTCQWHPYPYRSVRTDSDYLAGHGLGALLCVHPNAVGALARVALHPRTPALRGATIVKLMAITDQEHALARKDVDALLDDFQARGRDRMTVKQPFFLPPA
jgi:hypothetical protein